MQDFAALIARLLAGNPQAWKDTVTTYAGLLLAVLRRYQVPASNYEDLTQDIWVKVIHSLTSFARNLQAVAPQDAERYFRHWLGCVAASVIVDNFRRRKRASAAPLGAHDPPAPEPAPQHLDPEDPNAEWAKGLTKEERQVIRLYLGGYNGQTVAKKLKRSAPVVSRIVKSIHKKLGLDG